MSSPLSPPSRSSYAMSASGQTSPKPIRPPPPPLRLQQSNSSPVVNRSLQSPPPSSRLLYEIPRSPPPPASSQPLLLSTPPTSPSKTRHQHPQAGLGGFNNIKGPPTSPPPRSRSTTPLPPPGKQDLDVFTEQCHAWYYEQDALSGKLMTQTLANLPPAQRATYTRIQASNRSAFHADQSLRRISEFRALLSSTQPGGSLMPSSRSSPNSARAKKERAEKFGHFIRTHCVATLPGTHPFFHGLYTALRLQTLPSNLGGAGERLIEWEFDDAVFMESAGKDFMLEAVDILKGVLAFQDSPSKDQSSSSPSSMHIQEEYDSDGSDHLGESQFSQQQYKLTSSSPATSSRLAPHSHTYSVPITSTTATNTQSSRSRASSDPFLDPNQSSVGRPPTFGTIGDDAPTDLDDSVGPSTPEDELSNPLQHPPRSKPSPRPRGSTRHRQDPSETLNTLSLAIPHLRIWTFPPHLANAEIHTLLPLFPSFITQQSVPRFAVIPKSRKKSAGGAKALEEGADVSERGEVKVGTGSMWVGGSLRNDGWKGGWLTRMMDWFRRMFC